MDLHKCSEDDDHFVAEVGIDFVEEAIGSE